MNTHIYNIDMKVWSLYMWNSSILF